MHQGIASRKERRMQFRWVAFITLWTMFIGPVLQMPFGSPNAQPNPIRVLTKTKTGAAIR